ncbi:MAG: DUF86 domain-containing protein [Acidimicrobiia bacterium]|nr:DUF86 domain-containing protein [Acidimicrobiia bacterium]
MQRDPRSFVWDARRAIAHLRSFVAGKTWADYEADVLLRSGVERQFEIIGEALNRLSKADPEAAARVDDLARIVAFRNILIHGYAVVDDRLVWDAVSSRLDRLDADLAEIEAGFDG